MIVPLNEILMFKKNIDRYLTQKLKSLFFALSAYFFAVFA